MNEHLQRNLQKVTGLENNQWLHNGGKEHLFRRNGVCIQDILRNRGCHREGKYLIHYDTGCYSTNQYH